MSEALRMSRLELLKKSGALGCGLAFGGLLLGCGDDSGSSTATASNAVSPEDAASRLAAATGTVRGLYWTGYDLGKSALPAGVDLKHTAMAAIEDPINKRGRYDVGVNVSGLFPQQDQAGAMQPLDLDLLPALADCVTYSGLVDSNKVPKFATIDGQAYGVGSGWDPFVVSHLPEAPPVENLDDLLGPEYTGKFGIGDDATSAIMMVSSSMGMGGDRPGYLTQDEFDQVFDKLGQFKENAKGFIANPYGEYPSQYVRGEIIAAFPDFPGTAATSQVAGVKVDLALTGGSFSYADTWFVGANSEAGDAAYAFMNTMLQEKSQLAVGKLFTSGVFNQAAMNKLRPKGSVFEDPDALLEKAPMREWPPLESDQYVPYGEWSKRWDELKL